MKYLFLLLIALTATIPTFANAQGYESANPFNLNGTDELPPDLQNARNICEEHRHSSGQMLLSNPPQFQYYYDDGFSKPCNEIERKVFTYANSQKVKNKKRHGYYKQRIEQLN